jgi:hypothetical protein
MDWISSLGKTKVKKWGRERFVVKSIINASKKDEQSIKEAQFLIGPLYFKRCGSFCWLVEY